MIVCQWEVLAICTNPRGGTEQRTSGMVFGGRAGWCAAQKALGGGSFAEGGIDGINGVAEECRVERLVYSG